MLKTRIKRQAARAERTALRLAAVEASVVALVDEDLLDLADIFSGKTHTPLWEMASDEMRKRQLTL
jgi:hypothetical protein